MEKLLQYIRSLTQFSEESWLRLQIALTEKTFQKGEFLLKAGEICQSLFYIEQGYCRSCYEIDGDIKNTGFFFENEIATNVNSFGSGQKSKYNIVACEPLKAILFDKELLFEIAKTTPEIDALGHSCIRRFAMKQDEFSDILQIYSTQQRLEFIEEKYPEMLQRIPLSQLASFLGVARETLSRIRNKRTVK